jgi:hypothetical protein
MEEVRCRRLFAACWIGATVTRDHLHQENKFASAVFMLTSACVACLFLSLSSRSLSLFMQRGIHPSGSSTYNIIILMPMLRQDEKVIFAGIHMVGFKGRASVHLHQSGRVWLLTNSNPRHSFHCV